jgi:hypothetical protein
MHCSKTRPVLGFYPIERTAASIFLSHYLIFGSSCSLALGRAFDNSGLLHKYFYFKEIACPHPHGIISSQMSNLANIFNVLKIILSVVNGVSLGAIWNFLMGSTQIQTFVQYVLLFWKSLGIFFHISFP